MLPCFGQYEIENLRGEALESNEFHELKLSYNQYRNYAKKNTSLTARIKCRTQGSLKDTIARYSFVKDSLVLVMRSKSKVFYSKFSMKAMDLTVDEMKAWLDN